jgi:hypothetical protein
MDIEKALQKSIDLYLNNFGLFFLTSSVVTIISVISMGILAGPLIGGAMTLTLNLIRNKPATYREIFSHFDKFLPTTLISTPSLFFLFIIRKTPIIGVFLGIALSPFILVIMTFVIVLIIEKNYPPLSALKETITFIKTDPIVIWIYALITIILSAIGTVAFGIGTLLTIPFSIICMTVAFQDYFDKR